MASKLLSVLIIAAGFSLLAPAFVSGLSGSPTAAPRTRQAAVPEAMDSVDLQSSVSTALEVSTPGWWANIVLLVIPCAIFIIIYLQSERTKFEAATK
ncbi:unnamed protein product [Symbiodinium pilosum]|uniref:Uncharacterized protein n=1 Tax=Symbiodinium pilosum TaxID=2952 RepID=A0A812QJ73_SYMPI|nr:unnamed protein product [Symbiodinium pilosum]